MSMARKLVKTADSPSLWNYSLSPGWTQETSEILRLAIIKFGCGNWKAIIESNFLPGKTRSQLNLQTQRMVGQQSIAEFKGIHLDTRVVWKDVQEKHRHNPNALVKNGLIINTGNNQTKEEKDNLRRLNTKKYSLPRKDIQAVELKVVDIEDIVAEGKGKRRRVKERKVLAPGESEKLTARLKALRDRLSVLEKELKDRGVPLVDPAMKKPIRLAATAPKRKRPEDAFGFNDECFEDEEEEEEEEEEEIIVEELDSDDLEEEVEIIEEELLEEEVEDELVEIVEEEEVEAEGEEESGFSGEEPPDVFYFGSESNGHVVDEAADDFVSAVEEEDDSDFEEEPSRKKRRIAATAPSNGKGGLLPPKRGLGAALPPKSRPVQLH